MVDEDTLVAKKSVIDLVEKLKDAMAEGLTVRIQYTSGKGETTERIIEPLGLTLESFHWHLFAYCKLRDDTRFFRVDRMEEIEVLDDPIIERDLPPMQQRMLDLMRSRPKMEVLLKFSKGCDPERIRRRCSYNVNFERTTEEGTELSLRMNDLSTLAQWLLPYGKDVTIMHPPEMKRLMHEITRELFEHHRM